MCPCNVSLLMCSIAPWSASRFSERSARAEPSGRAEVCLRHPLRLRLQALTSMKALLESRAAGQLPVFLSRRPARLLHYARCRHAQGGR
jgi:hypothetical protein